VALYRFVAFDDCAALRAPLQRVCDENGVKGILLLAPEGINGTIAGTDDGIGRVLAHIRAMPGCAEIEIKESRTDTLPFLRMKVRLKREIVTMGVPDLDPARQAGQYVAPAEWNALISAPDTIVIDTRNDYEVAVGTFDGAINPNTKTFRDFPDWFRANRQTLMGGANAPRVAMFCTGGIRCEKATAYLKSEGIEDVFHLQGGILKYFEDVPAEDSLWRGECFVFDQRVTVAHDLTPGSHDVCHGCRHPVSAADKASQLYVQGVSCPHCHDQRSDAQKARSAERERQEMRARSRGTTHIGISGKPAKGA